jgi:hypothetical protein
MDARQLNMRQLTMRALAADPLSAAFHAAGLLLIGVFLWVNFASTWMVVDVLSPGDDTIQVFYSWHGAWSEQESLRRPLAKGFNRVSFDLPGHLGPTVRLDPGMESRNYTIVGVHWIRGGFPWRGDLAGAVASGTIGSRQFEPGGALTVSSNGIDPQVIVPTPPVAWRASLEAAPFLIFAALLAIAINGVVRRRSPTRFALAWLLAAAQLFGLICSTCGVTLPFLDDWRYLYLGSRFSFLDGNFDWASHGSNDTYYVIGQLIDYATLHLSHFDFVAVRAVAFALLLVFLALTAAVIVAAAGRGFVAAVGILALTFVLSNYTYWGITAIAYHQFLPLLFGAIMLWLVVGAPRDFPVVSVRMGLLLLFGICAGLSYISGVFVPAALGAAIVLTDAEKLRRPLRSPAIVRGIILMLLGVVLLAVQIWIVALWQGSLFEHVHSNLAPLYPNNRRFWEFFIALYARASSYVGASIALDLAIAAVFVAPGIVLAFRRLHRGAFQGRAAAAPKLTLCALFAVFTSILYSAAVAYGRGPYLPADGTHAATVGIMKAGFHYWWLAALAPLCWLGWVALVEEGVVRGRIATRVLAVAMIVLLLPKSTASLDIGQIMWAQEREVRGAYQMAADLPKALGGQQVQNLDLLGTPAEIGGWLQRFDAAHYAFVERIRASSTEAPVRTERAAD